MEWRYGLMKKEKAIATVTSFDEENRCGFAVTPKLSGRIFIRESDILFPCGPYNIPTDDVSKDIAPGEVIACMVIETQDGLMGIGCRKEGVRLSEWDWHTGSDDWEMTRIPRFMGLVDHYNPKKSYGFIKSDFVRSDVFFQKTELLVSYEETADPYSAASREAGNGEMVTFDCVETPNGLRALAVKKWMGE